MISTKIPHGPTLVKDKLSVPIEVPFKLEAGIYWVGDLCYVLSDDDWYRGCEHFYSQMALSLTSGGVAYMFSTYGDGNHRCSGNVSFPVDSGSIGIVSANDVTPVPGRGIARVFSAPFVCESDYENDMLTFGDLVVYL